MKYCPSRGGVQLLAHLLDLEVESGPCLWYGL